MFSRPSSSQLAALPWRGPGPGRPAGLALPPGELPLLCGRALRKRWRYLGVYGEEHMLCAARAEVGPFVQTFWALWDRGRAELVERTRTRLPGASGEVWSETHAGEPIGYAPEEGATVRIDAHHPQHGEVRGRLRCGEGSWVESICPNGEGAYVWTRKRVVQVECDLRIGERRVRITAPGIEDESAGYHPRHTVWSWSAGVGRASDGRNVGWNLVAGVNDPPEHSERSIWVDGVPFEPGPAGFEALEAISFDGGERLSFAAEAERSHSENRILLRSSYRQPFGTFSGTLPGGIELERGLGVMEHHQALW